MLNTIEEAITDLKQGKIIILIDDENRENEGDFLCLAEFATPENINFMAKYGRGLICMPIHEEIAQELQLHPMVSNNTDFHQTAFTVSIDHETTSTGISAFDRSKTMLQVINPEARALQFKRPGHVFPLIAKPGGVLERRGHTEAAVDFGMLCASSKAGVICEIMNEDGTMARLPDLLEFAQQFQVKIVTIEELSNYLINIKGN
ncbi:3,4-dihydroxy 2-butanone 4-phosphate synthase / GTP cyclohydrolase II [Paenisporosarcina quisquiliarum]|nr:3,4-dihydroxy 2-butanone 4-phosphate synthase / GTP cyclohydrolase II [Paenisporosarcina quisquiliarum]